MQVRFYKYLMENAEKEEIDGIENDYGIDKDVPEEIIKFSEKAIEQFKKDIELYKDIEIVFVRNIGGLLGKFRSGTASSTPIILLSKKNILQSAKKYNVSIKTTIETTIFHELGHALCELDFDLFGGRFLKFDNEEEWVENFAYDYYNWGTIPDELENLIDELKN